MIRFLRLFCLGVLSAAFVCPVAFPSQPTDEEQLMLELLNRARAAPEAEAGRHGIDLNEGIEPGMISAAPKQPLAFHPDLIDAAREHSRWMLEEERFSHTGEDGSEPQDRIEAVGYPMGAGGAWMTGENLAMKASSEGLDLPGTTEFLHSSLFVNEGIAERTHRQTMMTEDFREIGMGVYKGTWEEEGRTLDAVVATQKYAVTDERGPFLTGVAFRDEEGDGFYRPGLGVGSVEVIAVRRGDGRQSRARTIRSGGYTLELRPGVYDIVFRDVESLARFRPDPVEIDDQNVKVDWVMEPAEGDGS